ncbi:MAG: YxlC family protein [Bacilli bacterium]
MKDNRLNGADDHEQKKEEQETVEQLQATFTKLDEWFPAFTPDLKWFEQQVEAEKRRLHKKMFRELAIFWLVALFILGVVFAILNRQPFALLYIQLIGILALPFALRSERRKKVNSE